MGGYPGKGDPAAQEGEGYRGHHDAYGL